MATAVFCGHGYAAFPGVNGRIVFTKDDFDNFGVEELLGAKLFTVEPDGRGLRKLTDNSNYGDTEFHPSASPDGTRIAFHGNRLRFDRFPPRRVDSVLVVPADGSESELDIGEGTTPAWLPNGEELSFYRRRGDGIPEIVVHHLRSGAERVVATGHDPAWSPDGRWLALSKPGGGIWVKDLASGRETRIVNWGHSPDWSPDGTTIVFAGRQPQSPEGDYLHDIFTVPAGGGDPRQLTNGHRDDDPEFSPDGQYIVFSRVRDSPDVRRHDHIWVMTADGGNQRRVTDFLDLHNRNQFPTWLPAQPSLEVDLDGAQVAVNDVFDLDMRLTNRGARRIAELTYPGAAGLVLLDLVDPGEVRGDVELDTGPVPALPQALDPDESVTVRYRFVATEVGQVWLGSEVTGLDQESTLQRALAAGVVRVSETPPTLEQLAGHAYFYLERIQEEAAAGRDRVSRAMQQNLRTWLANLKPDPDQPLRPTEFQLQFARQARWLFPDLTDGQIDELALFFPRDAQEAVAMMQAVSEGQRQGLARVGTDLETAALGVYNFVSGGPLTWRAGAQAAWAAVKQGKERVDGAVTAAMTPFANFAYASEDDRRRMLEDMPVALDRFRRQAVQTIEQSTQQAMQTGIALTEQYREDKTGFVRAFHAEKTYWEAQAALAVMTEGAGTAVTQAAAQSPKVAAALRFLGSGNAVKGAARVQAAVDWTDRLAPVLQPFAETMPDPEFRELELVDGITQHEAEQFMEVARLEEERLRRLGYDVEIGIGASQGSPESAAAWKRARAAREADPSVPLPRPKGEALKDFKSLTALDRTLGAPQEMIGFVGVYPPKLPADLHSRPAAEQKALRERAEQMQQVWDGYTRPSTKIGQLVRDAQAPGGKTFELDFGRTESWELQLKPKLDDVGNVVGVQFFHLQPGPGGTKIPVPIIQDVDIATVLDVKTGKLLPAGERAKVNLRIKAELKKRGVRLADHGWDAFDLRSRSRDLVAHYKARLERMDPVEAEAAAEAYAEKLNDLLGLTGDERLDRAKMLKGIKRGRKTILFTKKKVTTLPRPRSSAVARAPAKLRTSAVRRARTPFVVDSTADAPDTFPGDGSCATAGGRCTLRAAVQEAAAGRDGAEITLPAGRYALAVAGQGEDRGATGDLDVQGTVTIAGAGAGSTTIDAQRLDRVFDVHGGSTFTLSGVTLTGGVADGDGGGLRAGRATLTLTDVVLRANAADGDGGGLFAATGTVRLTDVTFADNAGHGGGGLFAERAALTVERCRFTANAAEAGGGAGVVFASALAMSASTFAGNRAVTDGGGLWIQGVTADSATEPATLPTLRVTGCTFTDNDGGERGGAVAITHLSAPEGDGRIELRRNTFRGNTADRGGAVDTDPDLTTVEESDFEGNRALLYDGGAIAAVGPLHVRASTFLRNRTAGDGGAIAARDELVVENSTFDGNTADGFGGAAATHASTSIGGTTFLGNEGQLDGGALYLAGAEVTTLSGSTLTGNRADVGNGGAIYRTSGPLLLVDNRLADNTPEGAGDGIALGPDGSIVRSTTTTTIAPAACTADAQCDDGDPCTQGACAGGACTHMPFTGFADADCQLAKLLTADACAGDPVAPKLAKALTTGVGRVRTLLQKAEAASGKKRARLVGKAQRLLAALARKATKSRRTGPTCRVSLAGSLNGLRRTVGGLAR